MTKICTKCNVEKELSDFYSARNKSGYRSKCKACLATENKKYRKHNSDKISKQRKVYYTENRDVVLSKSKSYYANNKDSVNEYKKTWREANKDTLVIKRREYYLENRSSILSKQCDYAFNRFKTDPVYRMITNIRSRIRSAIKQQSGSKAYKSIELLGCSSQKARMHLELQFTEGMTWDNYGKWHVDHIRPCSNFDLTDPEQQKECFNYTNLQPLWAEDNLRKSSKYTLPS
jgi:hypothetical protein